MRLVVIGAITTMVISISALAETKKVTFIVDGMTCPSCAASVERHLKTLPQVDSVDISLSAKAVTVTLKNGTELSIADASKAVQAAGYKINESQKTAKKESGG